jgi:hypothetical protein
VLKKMLPGLFSRAEWCCSGLSVLMCTMRWIVLLSSDRVSAFSDAMIESEGSFGANLGLPWA